MIVKLLPDPPLTQGLLSFPVQALPVQDGFGRERECPQAGLVHRSVDHEEGH